MTYYGRWTYKYEIASDKGAAAAIIIHETGPAGYPYDVVQQQQLAGAVRRHLARRREARAGRRLDHARQGEGAARATRARTSTRSRPPAAKKDFKPVALNAKATFDVKIDVAKDSVAQRRREARGHRQEGRVRHLHRALGSPRQGHDAQGRPDLQRRDGQRVGSSATARDREGVHASCRRRRSARSCSSR